MTERQTDFSTEEDKPKKSNAKKRKIDQITKKVGPLSDEVDEEVNIPEAAQQAKRRKLNNTFD